MSNPRRSTRKNKGVRYTAPPPREAPIYKRKRRTMKYYLEQAAVLPAIGDPDTVIETPVITQVEFAAMFGLMPTKRKFEEEPTASDQTENQKWENDSGKAANKTSEPPPEKKPKQDQ
ncbi:uncharacterized protein LOC143785987 [Ranitomeya variabilis]|uniref:uncharacterized protein LOC143785987 n=1 Tax=Ranitomeya variabilis TaxID=490064 RepID=UPI004055AD6D